MILNELFMLFPVEIERIPFENGKYTPEILRQHIETGSVRFVKNNIHNGRIIAGYVIKINVYPTS